MAPLPESIPFFHSMYHHISVKPKYLFFSATSCNQFHGVSALRRRLVCDATTINFYILFLQNESGVAAAAILTHAARRSVLMEGHEHAGSAVRALPAEALDHAVVTHLVVLKHSKFYLTRLMLGLLRSRIHLLLPLLGTTAQTQNKMECGFLLNIIVRKRALVLQLLAGEDETLLVRRDTLLVLDHGFDIDNTVGRLHLEGDSLPSQGLNEDLHALTARRQFQCFLLTVKTFIGFVAQC